jgi:hypothetical protein
MKKLLAVAGFAIGVSTAALAQQNVPPINQTPTVTTTPSDRDAKIVSPSSPQALTQR